MSRTYTLEELKHGLEEFTTVSPQQFAVKSALLATLGQLQAMRNHLQTGKKLDDDKFACDLATVLGEVPTGRRS
jgi:hypothetical protein